MKHDAVSRTKIITKTDNTIAMGMAIRMSCQPTARAYILVAYPLVAGAMVAEMMAEVGIQSVFATKI